MDIWAKSLPQPIRIDAFYACWIHFIFESHHNWQMFLRDFAGPSRLSDKTYKLIPIPITTRFSEATDIKNQRMKASSPTPCQTPVCQWSIKQHENIGLVWECHSHGFTRRHPVRLLSAQTVSDAPNNQLLYTRTGNLFAIHFKADIQTVMELGKATRLVKVTCPEEEEETDQQQCAS